MVKKTSLIDQVQHAIETFRDNATLGAQFGTIPLPYFRELAVSIVQVFRDYVGDEIKIPYVRDSDQLGKRQGND